MTLIIVIAIIILVVYLFKRKNKGNHQSLEVISERVIPQKKVDKEESEKFCVIVDIETTGLVKFKDLIPTKSNLSIFPHILAIGWGVFSERGEAIHQGDFLIKQKHPIPPSATKINGITNERCEQDGKELAEVLRKFASDINGCLRIVGHNIMFDKRILEAEYIREGMVKPFKGMTNYDTMTMGKGYCRMEKWPKLGELFEEITGESSTKYKSNRTMGDVAMTAKIFFYLKKKGKIHAPRKIA